MSIEARDPVQMAIQRHMGIDNDKRSQTQQGIAVIIGGGPFAGKTLIARQVCKSLHFCRKEFLAMIQNNMGVAF